MFVRIAAELWGPWVVLVELVFLLGPWEVVLASSEGWVELVQWARLSGCL